MSNQPVRKDLERLEKVIGPVPEEKGQSAQPESDALQQDLNKRYRNRPKLVALTLLVAAVVFTLLKALNVL